MESFAALSAIRRRPRGVAALALAGALAACSRPDDGRALAASVVSAIEAGSMAGVTDDFTPDGARQLTDARRFAQARDALVKLGKLRGLEPAAGSTPAAAGGYRTLPFVAAFDGGTKRIDMTLDGDGKIAALWIH